MLNTRIYEFAVGVQTTAQPDAGTPVSPNDVVTFGYLQTNYVERRKVSGSYASPVLLNAGDQIDPGIVAQKDEYLVYLQGNGSSVDLSSSPQIVAPGRAGIKLMLVGCHATRGVLLEQGTGVEINGECRLLDKVCITLESIDATTWLEVSRNMI